MPFDAASDDKPKYIERLTCSFCAASRDDVAWLFRSGLGATGTCICDRCVDGIAGVLAAYDREVAKQARAA